MSKSKQNVGSVSWTDLTVPDAKKVRDFYKAVTGWTASPVKMGSYSDFCMNEPKIGRTVAGICHARGDNKDLPPQWLIYITVADVEASAKKCVKMGGKVLSGPRDMGGQGRVAVIEDPAGAVAALFQPA
ncbi:MAG: Lactoylglutathione lyase-like protein [Pedosphaera sp.]|nr:Lactoylglutathione lyase-like protein [Pedosphaera sp.]